MLKRTRSCSAASPVPSWPQISELIANNQISAATNTNNVTVSDIFCQSALLKRMRRLQPGHRLAW